MSIGHRLRDHRRRRGVFGAAMAAEFGVSENTWSAWERGIRFPHEVHWYALSAACEIPVEEFEAEFTARKEVHRADP